jgi:hypothetical protein
VNAPTSSALSRRTFLGAAAVSLAALALPLPAGAQTPWRVGIQAGHWRSLELPDELRSIRGGGTSGGGVAEWELNLAVARLAAVRLEAAGVQVDVLPATVPPGYKADAFVSLHADGDATGRFSGFKLARAARSVIPDRDDHLLASISSTYAEATGLPLDPHISRNMTGYYAWASRRFTHAIAPSTPGVILEIGFMTNSYDLRFMLNNQDLLAAGISRGIYRFLEESAASADRASAWVI